MELSRAHRVDVRRAVELAGTEPLARHTGHRHRLRRPDAQVGMLAQPRVQVRRCRGWLASSRGPSGSSDLGEPRGGTSRRPLAARRGARFARASSSSGRVASSAIQVSATSNDSAGRKALRLVPRRRAPGCRRTGRGVAASAHGVGAASFVGRRACSAPRRPRRRSPPAPPPRRRPTERGRGLRDARAPPCSRSAASTSSLAEACGT